MSFDVLFASRCQPVDTTRPAHIGRSVHSSAPWSRAPSAPEVRGAWRLTELRLFAGSSCSGPLSGDAVASGYKPGAGPELAFDGDAATFWESSCDGCQVGCP